MKNATNKKSKWFGSTWKVALSLFVMIAASGCGKKDSNNHGVAVVPPPVIDPGYQYGGQYCQQLNGCYGQPGYGNMFVSALGKVNSPSSLQAEIAVSFSATGGYTNMNAYAGNAGIVATMNVYNSTAICPIPPGQYQFQGSGMTFNSGMSFTGTVYSTAGASQVKIDFVNSFLGQGPVTSSVGPTFMYKAQNDIRVSVQTPYGFQDCGPYVMY